MPQSPRTLNNTLQRPVSIKESAKSLRNERVPSKLAQPWIPADRIEALMGYEPALVIVTFAIASWVFYKLLLRDLSVERHFNLRKLFKNLISHLGLWILLFFTYLGLHSVPEAERISTYIGLMSVIWGCTIFVKTARITAFEYLFFLNKHVGVPVLLVNLFSLLLSLLIGSWILTEIFSVKLVPLVATSAIFSLVLGLAAQDTLGNLFAGIALQFDKPFAIGDWVEIFGTGQKWVGQVHEISWRATVLLGLSEEEITIPNRVIAQSEISNFAYKGRPLIRIQFLKLPLGTDMLRVKKVLTDAALSVPLVLKIPSPLVLLSEVGESWLTVKLAYFIEDYGSQFRVTDQVLNAALSHLEEAKISTAGPRLFLRRG